MPDLEHPRRSHPLRGPRPRLSGAAVRAGLPELAHRALEHESGASGRPQDWLDPIAGVVRRVPADRARRAQRRTIARDASAATTTGRPTPAITWRCSIIWASSSATSWARASAFRSRWTSSGRGRDWSRRWCCRTRSACPARNRAALDHEFDHWADAVKGWPNIDAQRLPGFRQRMFGGDFIFSVTREFVRDCAIPTLLMPGDDVVHPAEVSADLARMRRTSKCSRRGRVRNIAMRRCARSASSSLRTCLEPNPRDKDLPSDENSPAGRLAARCALERRLVAVDRARRRPVLRGALRRRGRCRARVWPTSTSSS